MSKFDRYIGIDPGTGGGIAQIGSDNHVTAVKMPANVDDMHSYFTYLKDISESPIACVERVNLWRTDHADGRQFGIEKLTRNLNQVTTVLRIVKIPFIQVFPVQWMSYLSLREKGEDKAERKRRFKEIAQTRFPNITPTLNTADAILLMLFIAFKCQREPEWVLGKLPESVVKSLDL